LDGLTEEQFNLWIDGLKLAIIRSDSTTGIISGFGLWKKQIRDGIISTFYDLFESGEYAIPEIIEILWEKFGKYFKGIQIGGSFMWNKQIKVPDDHHQELYKFDSGIEKAFQEKTENLGEYITTEIAKIENERGNSGTKRFYSILNQPKTFSEKDNFTKLLRTGFLLTGKSGIDGYRLGGIQKLLSGELLIPHGGIFAPKNPNYDYTLECLEKAKSTAIDDFISRPVKLSGYYNKINEIFTNGTPFCQDTWDRFVVDNNRKSLAHGGGLLLSDIRRYFFSNKSETVYKSIIDISVQKQIDLLKFLGCPTEQIMMRCVPSPEDLCLVFLENRIFLNHSPKGYRRKKIEREFTLPDWFPSTFAPSINRGNGVVASDHLKKIKQSILSLIYDSCTLRREEGETQQSICEDYGVSNSTISKWVKDRPFLDKMPPKLPSDIKNLMDDKISSEIEKLKGGLLISSCT